MAKKHKTAKSRFNKKGAALAYTMIATMVLMILSTSLFTAANYNISLTTKNSNARQSYITCKSAVEYAKSVILQKAKDAKQANLTRENNSNLRGDYSQALATCNAVKDLMASFYIRQDSNSASVSGMKVVPITDTGSEKKLATCQPTLGNVTRTIVQAVTTATAKTGGGYAVSEKNQTITSKIIDPNIGLNVLSNWEQIDLKESTPTKPVDSTTQIGKTEILFVRYVFTYNVRITAESQYSASDDRMQKLNYETVCTIGGTENAFEITPPPVKVITSNPGIEIFAVGGQYGGAGGGTMVNSNGNDGYSLSPNASSDMAVVFKREIKATGNSGSINAPSVYFMNSGSSTSSLTVGNMNDPSSNGHSATIISNFVYFNGNINGTKNDQGSWLKLYKRDKNSPGIVQFNNTTIQLSFKGGSTQTKVLDGLYYFNDNTDLFDFSSLGSKLTAVPEADYAKISSIANQDYVNYLKSNIDNIVSGEIANGNNIYSSDFAGWVGQGRLVNGAPSVQTGKTVYCYAGSSDGWYNKLDETDKLNNKTITCHPYAAKNIVFSWVGYGALEIGDKNRTATFQADYISMSTNGQPIRTWWSSSQFVVKSVSGSGTLTMVFPTDTQIVYNPTGEWNKGVTYTITAGTYGAVPSGTNLFSNAAKSFFENTANHTYEGVSGSVTYGSFTGIGEKLEDVVTPNFLLYGDSYGGNPDVISTANSPEFVEVNRGKGVSSYPVLFNQTVQITGGQSQARLLKATQLYFMNSEKAISGNNEGSVTLYSDFIYIAGRNITGAKDNHIYLDTYSAANGVIYFAQACVLQGISNGNTYYIIFTPGYYSFAQNSKVDLCDYYTLNSLKKITDQTEIDKIKKANYTDYITSQHDKVISGDINDNAPTKPYYAAANWAPNGKLRPADPNNPSYYGLIEKPKEKDLYLYVNDASDWSNAAKWDAAVGTNYQAARINLQYVNTGALTVAAGKQVTFTADNLLLNGQKTDVQQADDKLVLQQGNADSEFKVSTLNGIGYVNVTLPHDLYINNSSGKSYKVPAGVYKVKSGTNLFDYSPDSGSSTTISPEKIKIEPIGETLFKKGKYTNE